MDITERIKNLEGATNNGIKKAVDSNNDELLNQLVRQKTEIKHLKEEHIALLERLSRLESGNGIAHSASGEFRGRTIEVHVTQGMINQNLLTLTEALRERKVRDREKFLITALPSGDKFATDLAPAGNKLRERGYIGKFYRDTKVIVDDIVLLQETAPGQWELQKTGKKYKPFEYV